MRDVAKNVIRESESDAMETDISSIRMQELHLTVEMNV